MNTKRKYLIYHWTAGTNEPNDTDLSSYQLLITGTGKTVAGIKATPSAIAGLNSITYNISLCGMRGSQVSKGIFGKYPLKGIQLEHAWEEGAKYLLKHNLPTSHIYTHSVIGDLYTKGLLLKELGIPYNDNLKHNRTKQDIDKLIEYPDLGRYDILNLFRKKVAWYMTKLSKEVK